MTTIVLPSSVSPRGAETAARLAARAVFAASALLMLAPIVSLTLVASDGAAHVDHTATGPRNAAPPPEPPANEPDRALAAIVATLQRSGRGDALIIGDRRVTAIGAGRALAPSFYRPTGVANVMAGRGGKGVALPAFGSTRSSGALVTATGVALREYGTAAATSATMSFVVPCATTSLAPGQFAYVYVGGFTRAADGAPRLTEIGVQMNPPAGGGRPRSVQLYTRRVTGHGVVATDAGVHLRCDAPLTVRFGPLGPNAEAATFSGASLPTRSGALTLVERLEPGERTGDGYGNALERVTALAVPAGTAVVRRGSRLGVGVDGREPRLAFERDRDFAYAPGSRDAMVLSIRDANRTRVAIDENGARASPVPKKPSFVHDSAPIAITMVRAPRDAPVATIRAPFRYVFAQLSYGWDQDPAAAIEAGHAYVGRNNALVDFDLATHREMRLANTLPSGGAYLAGHILVYGFGQPGTGGTVVALDRTGAILWRRHGELIGAGSGQALLRIPSSDPRMAEFDSGQRLIDLDAASGARRWVNPSAGCAPRPPIRFLARWVVLDWAGACAVSANEPFLMFLRLRDGAMRDTRDATAVLAREGNELYLTGDDIHYGEYGPGNISIYDAGTAALLRKRTIAPDAPVSGDVAFDSVARAYALGDALWVQLANADHPYAAAVYRYDVHDMRARPSRLDPRFGTWLGAAFSNETYVQRGHALVALVMTSADNARAEPFSGKLAPAAEAIADERAVYVREYGGRIAVFDRITRRELRVVNAGCGLLQAIERAGPLRYALCLEPGNPAVLPRQAFVAL
jgi:hypothetical protein